MLRKAEKLSICRYLGDGNAEAVEGRTNADDIELETSLQQLALNLRGDTIETNMAVGIHSGRSHCLGFICLRRRTE